MTCATERGGITVCWLGLCCRGLAGPSWVVRQEACMPVGCSQPPGRTVSMGGRRVQKRLLRRLACRAVHAVPTMADPILASSLLVATPADMV